MWSHDSLLNWEKEEINELVGRRNSSIKPVEYSDDVKKIVNSKLCTTFLQVVPDNRQNVVGVPDPHREVRTTPNMEVEEKVSHKLPVLFVVVA